MKFSTRKWLKDMLEVNNNKAIAESRIRYLRADLKRHKGDLWQFEIEGCDNHRFYIVMPEWTVSDEEYQLLTYTEYRKLLKEAIKELRKIA